MNWLADLCLCFEGKFQDLPPGSAHAVPIFSLAGTRESMGLMNGMGSLWEIPAGHQLLRPSKRLKRSQEYLH